MTNKIKIAPSILSADYAALGEGVANCEKWGADYVHVDVMDGMFVPNITFGMPMVKALRRHATIPFDVHLMITAPERYVELFADVGADIISFHPETTDSVSATIEKIKSKGKKVGLVLNPDKPLSMIIDYLPVIDQVILMGVYPGFGGQKFIPSVADKIADLSSIILDNGYSVDIELDGGVTEGNIDSLLQAGVTVVVGGSSVFGSANPPATIRRLRGEV